MADSVSNWFGNITSRPAVIVDATSVDDIVAAVKDRVRCPSPVRAVGSNHSTSPCGTADGGTLIRMEKMNAILKINADTITAQGGALYIDLAEELGRHNLQFYVNTEIGSLSVGSAACCGTKDASMPGELGQVNSYITRIKMVKANGELLEVTEDQPELMQQVRSSYGTFGIVYEATFRVRKTVPMAVRHATFTLEEFTAKLPRFKTSGESMMYYIFPFDNLITIEFRRYNPKLRGKPDRVAWPLRNYLWSTAGPVFCSQVERDIPDKTIRYGVIDSFCSVWRFKLENLVRGENTLAADQIIRYPKVADSSRYTFSLSAFPEEKYPAVLKKYFAFCKKYYKEQGYRTNMLNVGYWIAKDQSSLLSYSFDGPVMTIDPVSTGNPGWPEFLDAYNEFCIANGGIPLFNQSDRITPDQMRKALGGRLKTFAAARRVHDPGDRFLNPYFRDMLS